MVSATALLLGASLSFVSAHPGNLSPRLTVPGRWESLGGTFAPYAPSVVAWGPNRLDLFGVGLDSAMWHRWWDGRSWNNWEFLGGQLTSSPIPAAWGPNRLDLFSVGVNSSLMCGLFIFPLCEHMLTL